MDERTRASLVEILPNFPEALLREWIEPYVETDGLPGSSPRWHGLLGGYPLDFWRSVSWELERINLVDVVVNRLTLSCMTSLTEMEDAYFNGAVNSYSIHIPDGEERAERVLDYIRKYGVLPIAPALLSLPECRFNIMDGNHRILAFIRAMKECPPAADAMQDVWIGRPEG